MKLSQEEQNRLIRKLREHIRFIQRSCQAYDQGDESEALRIATSLRVIFHTTAMSVSIVSHLGFENKQMLSSSKGHKDWKDYLSQEINLNSSEPIRMLPLLGHHFHKISIGECCDR